MPHSQKIPDGQRVDIGQGVTVVFPPGFVTTTANGVTGGLNAKGFAIFGGPIAIASNDIQDLVKAHARMNNLTFDRMQTVPVAGANRPLAAFHGTFNGVPVVHFVTPLIGRGYRVAVAVQAPLQAAASADFIRMVTDVLTNRILLP